jgi:NitT/TauT family transport system permease protein
MRTASQGLSPPESVASDGVLSRVARRLLKPENLVIAVAVVAWLIAGEIVPRYIFPPLPAVLESVYALLFTPQLGRHSLTTLFHVVTAVTLGMVIGLVTAAAAHYWPVSRKMVYLRLTPFLNSFPGLGWIFLAIIWFGLNDVTVLFAITLILVPFAVINIREGFVYLDAELLEMSSSFTKNGLRTFFRVVLPLLVPYLFGGLRICFGVAWKVALTTEMFGGNAGFGFLVNLWRTEYDLAGIFAVILIIVAFVHFTDRLLFQPIQRTIQRQYADK